MNTGLLCRHFQAPPYLRQLVEDAEAEEEVERSLRNQKAENPTNRASPANRENRENKYIQLLYVKTRVNI
jgi:hypothetical protein